MKDIIKLVKKIKDASSILDEAIESLFDGKNYHSFLDNPPSQNVVFNYLIKKFPDMEIEAYPQQFEKTVNDINFQIFSSFDRLDLALELTEKVRERYLNSDEKMAQYSLSHLFLAIACLDSNFRETTHFGEVAIDVIRTFFSGEERKLILERCSFCGDTEYESEIVFKGNFGVICDECVVKSYKLLLELNETK